MLPQKEEKFVFQSKPKAKHWPLIGKIILIFTILSIGFFIYIFQQDIRDRYTVSVFSPTAEIETITKDTEMTDSGKFYFFTGLPEINDAESFNKNCERKEQSSPILGCYVNKKIYIYNVKNDSRLQGVKSITAAHEMLHSAWDRLNSSQKEKLSTLLEKAFQNVKNDELIKRMEYYEREQPGDRAEELHSILGTEYSNLGSELENYYKRYFANRSKLVNIYDKYNEIFVDLTQTQKSLLTEINNLESILKAKIATYNKDVDQLNEDVEKLESTRPGIDKTNWSAVQDFNNKRDKLIARINELEVEYKNIQTEQDKYKSLINSYNSNVLVLNDYNNSIDSTLKSPATVSE